MISRIFEIWVKYILVKIGRNRNSFTWKFKKFCQIAVVLQLPGSGGGTFTELELGPGKGTASDPAVLIFGSSIDIGGGTKCAAFSWTIGCSKLFPLLASKNICSIFLKVVGVKVGVVKVGAPAAEEQSKRKLPLLTGVLKGHEISPK